ncbi:hypothetical protein ACFQJ8_27345 [Halocatena marina]|uniref:hypothetical protein n=1 Tax=Halocatena marina TaxID=2934937 RepID=UPI00361CDB5D
MAAGSEPAIECWPWLRTWIDTIYWLFGQEGGGSLRGPTEWIEGPYELTSRFGTEPATTQTQLGSTPHLASPGSS